MDALSPRRRADPSPARDQWRRGGCWAGAIRSMGAEIAPPPPPPRVSAVINGAAGRGVTRRSGMREPGDQGRRPEGSSTSVPRTAVPPGRGGRGDRLRLRGLG
ncbi:hypothetical protein H920_00211 [Fukomys damarensis]|uniref:Uncharacterized protein n=1 Tax=Fukomys damarensis TaxID=885580 RepID=A0A091E4S8_FUKDA|nr:hypothetical protein H920_00211 [Fukomys damarensis]